jgi:signal transduction histidine kinase
LAIENARLTEAIKHELELQKQTEELEVQRRLILEKVVKLGKFVTEVTDLRTTLVRIWSGVHNDMGFDRLGIFLYNTERESMDSTFGTNLNGEMVDEWDIWFPISDAATFMRVLERPDGMYFTHNYDIENNIQENNEMFGVKDFAAVAAWAGNKPVAVICVDNLITGRTITDEQLEALRLFTGYAGLAIENARLNEAINHELELQKQSEALEASRRIMLEKVVQLGQGVTEVKDIKTTIERIWHGVHDVIGFERPAIFLYDQETNTVNGTLGTDNNGRIVEEWHYQRTLDHEKPTSFMRALEQPNGLFYTDNFSVEFEMPENHEMYKVRDFASVAAWAADKPVAIITVDNNITGRKFTPTQLEALRLFGGYAGLAIQNSKLNTALQVELDQRQTLINELEDKNAELERFTYTVSHDLKSPLVTITGFLGFLENDALSGNTERTKSNINRIAAAAKKMQALLNDLLELSRVGRLMNPPEDIPFIDVINEAIDRVRGHLDEVNAIIEVQRDFPTINGDRERLIEVVQNLIENAVKYAKPKVNPRIEVGSSISGKDGKVIFYVRDNGIGVDPEYYDRIFGLFNKLDPHSEGTGIGLSLVKRIIEVHNGRVWVESEKGKGATFYFSLPTSQTKE